MEKTKVICLIGASGSGKTTIAKELEKTGYNIIQSYTSRPQREDGEWGHTFIKKYDIYKDKKSDKLMINDITHTTLHYSHDMIAYFNSYNSGHHYFATDEQVVRGYTNIYIVDSKGAEMVHEFYKESNIEVITVYLQVDKKIRKERLAKRSRVDLDIARDKWLEFKGGYTQEEYTNIKILSDISRRLSKDDKLFQTVRCDYVVDGNQEIDMVVDLVRDVI